MRLTTEQKKAFIRELSKAHTDLFHTLSPWMDNLFLTVSEHDFKNDFDFDNLARELYFMKAQQFIEMELFACKQIKDLLDDIDKPFN